MSKSIEIETERVDESDVPTADDETTVAQDSVENSESDVSPRQRSRRWRHAVAFGLLPGLVIALAFAAGYFKWLDSTARESQLDGIAAMRAATDNTVAMLSYKPDTIDDDLGAARDRLTGEFKDSYTSLIHDVVIPGSKQKKIAAQAKVAAAAPVSANAGHAVILLFINQTVTIGTDPPTDTASSVRVTLDKIDGQWLISQFEPI